MSYKSRARSNIATTKLMISLQVVYDLMRMIAQDKTRMVMAATSDVVIAPIMTRDVKTTSVMTVTGG